MSIIKRFRDMFTDPIVNEMDQDDLEDVKVYFTELFDSLLDIGIDRNSFDFSISLLNSDKYDKDPRISGSIKFKKYIEGRKVFYKFIISSQLRKFSEDMKSLYDFSDVFDEFDISQNFIKSRSELTGDAWRKAMAHRGKKEISREHILDVCCYDFKIRPK